MLELKYDRDPCCDLVRYRVSQILRNLDDLYIGHQIHKTFVDLEFGNLVSSSQNLNSLIMVALKAG